MTASISNSMVFKRSFVVILVFFSQLVAYSQDAIKTEANQSEKVIDGKRHFIAINPIKPCIGLPNLHYEFQLRNKLGFTAFSELLAYTVIPNFNHPDFVNTFGFSFYPFMENQAVNQGAFININTSYIGYFRDNSKNNSFANGIQIGYKKLFGKSWFLEPKLVLNYTYQMRTIMPGFELLLGINL